MRHKLYLATATLGALLALAGCKPSATGPTGNQPGGKAAPEMSLSIPTLDGPNVSLSQYKGKVVLVNFWATWCQPCQAEIPLLIGFNQKYGPKGLVILGVAMDDEGKKVVQPYVKNRHFTVNGNSMTMDYPILLGNDDVGDKFGGQTGLPTSYLYSRDGQKVRTIVGSLELGSSLANITKAIETELNSPGA